MARKLTFRQLLLTILAVWHDRSYKEIAAEAGLSQDSVSHYLRRERGGEMKDDVFDRLLAALPCRPGEVETVTACLESLAGLESRQDLTGEELAVVEEAALGASRLTRAFLTRTLRRSRSGPDFEDYPDVADLAAARRKAGEQWERLKDLPETMRGTVVRFAGELQNWALCERVCEESVQAVSQDLEHAAALARLARDIAEGARGPEGWRRRIQGYAAGHEANVLRVAGELKAADTGLAEALKLWEAGSDPGGVLDPGRLLNLEGALRRDQCQFDEALTLLDQAAAAGRFPELALVQKASTLEAMGEAERAIETLLQAAPFVENRGVPRLSYMMRFNLAVNYCHLGRYGDAAELVREVRDLATERGDENELSRVTWLEGRLAAGMGRTGEARTLLENARRAFESRNMGYDAALALLEEVVLLLDEGQTAEVKALALELTRVFDSKGVHREALAALRLFQEAAERETATADLARRVLRYLFRARHDQGLRFTAS